VTLATKARRRAGGRFRRGGNCWKALTFGCRGRVAAVDAAKALDVPAGPKWPTRGKPLKHAAQPLSSRPQHHQRA